MRDAYAMHLHSVPSRSSNPAIPAPIRKNVFGALFLLGDSGIIHQIGEVAPFYRFNLSKNPYCKITQNH